MICNHCGAILGSAMRCLKAGPLILVVALKPLSYWEFLCRWSTIFTGRLVMMWYIVIILYLDQLFVWLDALRCSAWSSLHRHGGKVAQQFSAPSQLMGAPRVSSTRQSKDIKVQRKSGGHSRCGKVEQCVAGGSVVRGRCSLRGVGRPFKERAEQRRAGTSGCVIIIVDSYSAFFYYGSFVLRASHFLGCPFFGQLPFQGHCKRAGWCC